MLPPQNTECFEHNFTCGYPTSSHTSAGIGSQCKAGKMVRASPHIWTCLKHLIFYLVFARMVNNIASSIAHITWYPRVGLAILGRIVGFYPALFFLLWTVPCVYLAHACVIICNHLRDRHLLHAVVPACGSLVSVCLQVNYKGGATLELVYR